MTARHRQSRDARRPKSSGRHTSRYRRVNTARETQNDGINRGFATVVRQSSDDSVGQLLDGSAYTGAVIVRLDERWLSVADAERVIGTAGYPLKRRYVVQVNQENAFLPRRCNDGSTVWPSHQTSPIKQQVIVATDLIGQQKRMIQDGSCVSSNGQSGAEFLVVKRRG